MKTEPNQSAFPSPDTIHPLDGTRHEPLTTGLSKREHYAGLAMQGIVSSFGGTINEADHAYIARHSVMAADYLIIALNEKEEQQ